MQQRWEFAEGQVRDVTAARREFTACLTTSATPDVNVLAAAVIFGELTANAVKYGAHPISATIEVDGGGATLVVEDGGAGFEHDELRPAGPTDQGGRGFKIASILARSIRCERCGDRFRITVELPLISSGDAAEVGASHGGEGEIRTPETF